MTTMELPITTSPHHLRPESTHEHYTPPEVVWAARTTLGAIDLDPASCAAANRVVRAARYFTKTENGFVQPWSGKVFLNPPGGWCDSSGREVIKMTKRRPACTVTGDCGLPAPHVHTVVHSAHKKWWQELVFNWLSGDVTAAIFVCFSIELLQTTQVDSQGPLPLDFPICYPAKRLAFTQPDGTVVRNPPHASAVICVSADATTIVRFKIAFAQLGHVVVPTPPA